MGYSPPLRATQHQNNRITNNHITNSYLVRSSSSHTTNKSLDFLGSICLIQVESNHRASMMKG
jgi:hypothetical protein